MSAVNFIKKTMFVSLMGTISSDPANAYLAIQLRADDVQNLIEKRQEVVTSTSEIPGSVKPYLVKVEGWKKNKDKPVLLDGEVIDLVGDTHQEFHMTLEEPDSALTSEQREQLVGAFYMIEFTVKGVSFMGKFVALQLSAYNLIDENKPLTEEQTQLLASLLPEVPHVSLYKMVDVYTVERTTLKSVYGYIDDAMLLNMDDMVPQKALEAKNAMKDDKAESFSQLWKGVVKPQNMSGFKKALISKLSAAVPQECELELGDLLKKTEFSRNMEYALGSLFQRGQSTGDSYNKLRRNYQNADEAFEKVSGVESIINLLFDIYKADKADEYDQEGGMETFQKKIVAAAASVAAELVVSFELQQKKVSACKSSSPLSPEQTKAFLMNLGQKLKGIKIHFDSSKLKTS